MNTDGLRSPASDVGTLWRDELTNERASDSTWFQPIEAVSLGLFASVWGTTQ